MSSWSGTERGLAVLVAVLMGVGSALAFAPLGRVFHSPDSSEYLRLASGHTELVMQPFASRQLGARVAAGFGRLLGGDLHAGFWLEAMLALVFTMGATCWLAVRTAAPRWLLLALMLVPSWPRLVEYLVLPDLWYAALLAGLLLLLARERYLWAALLMLPLMLSRESTSLTLICFVGACWSRWVPARRWLYAVTASVCAAVGSVVVGRLAAGSQPNVEHLPQAIYLFAKLPWNFLRNVAGVLPWSDANPELCTVPVWSMPIHFGPVHALGVCGFSFGQQLNAVEGTLTNYGVLPLLVGGLWWRHRSRDGRSVLLRFALLYGGVGYLLTPLLGAGFVHLMQYAWPLFLVALPQLFDEFATGGSIGRRWAGVGVFGVHLALPAILLWPGLYVRLAMGVALWAAGYLLLRRWLPAAGQGATERVAKSPN